MKCPRCSFEIPVGARFCARCGLKLEAPVPQPPVPAPVPVEDPFEEISSHSTPQTSLQPQEGAAPPPAYPAPQPPAPPVYRPPYPPVPPQPPVQPPAVPGPYQMPLQPAQPPKKKNTVLWICLGVGIPVLLVVIGLLLFFLFTHTDKVTTGGHVIQHSTYAPQATAAPTEAPPMEEPEEPVITPTPEPTPEPTAEPTPEPTAEPTSEPVTDAYYILPQSSTRKLTYNDIAHLTYEEMVLARNEIFARHGRCFDTEWIRDYFEQQSWYEGTIPASSFSKSMLSSIEIYNVNFLKDNESSAADIPVTNQTAENNASGTYADVIREAMDAIPNYMRSFYYGDGALYDLTGDGVDELLMLYFVDSAPDRPESCVFSVYTLENGKAKALLKEELLYMNAGGPDGELYVMLRDGATYLGARKSDGNPLDDGAWENPGYWNLYKVIGPTIQSAGHVDYYEYETDAGLDMSQSYATFDGKTVSYEEYADWRDRFTYVLYLDDWSETTTPLQELLDVVS